VQPWLHLEFAAAGGTLLRGGRPACVPAVPHTCARRLAPTTTTTTKRRCVSILPADVAPTAPEAVVATHTLRTLAGLAAVEGARADMEAQRQLLADIVK
jgi:hypothetical protein